MSIQHDVAFLTLNSVVIEKNGNKGPRSHRVCRMIGSGIKMFVEKLLSQLANVEIN